MVERLLLLMTNLTRCHHLCLWLQSQRSRNVEDQSQATVFSSLS